VFVFVFVFVFVWVGGWVGGWVGVLGEIYVIGDVRCVLFWASLLYMVTLALYSACY